MGTLTRHVSIQGRVQGVGYRASFSARAISLGVKGWVRNRSDGSVEAWVCGASEAVEALTAWAHQGPPLARVLHVVCNDESEAESSEHITEFEQRSTF